ncbi:hypothetical protein GX586_09345, partial [bacterium]|nr:hypothetical protein [bacterium]
MSPLNTFSRPSSLAAACSLLKRDANRVPLAGGTFLAAHMPSSAAGIVDLSGLGLEYVRKAGPAVAVGAMTTVDAMARSKALGPLAPLCNDVATQPLRNMITVGGNVMMPFKWSDLPLLCTVLDASFVLCAPKPRVVSAEALFAGPPRRMLKPGELLTEVRFEGLAAKRIARKKLVRAYDDVPALHIAVAATFARRKPRDIRIALVAGNALPKRIAAAESVLVASGCSPSSIPDAAAAASESDAPKDYRFSAAYV